MSTDRSEGTAVRSEADPERSESPPKSERVRDEPSPDLERLRRRLRRRTAEIERHEVESAVSALAARGDLTDEPRETVREFGSALVEELTAAPAESLAQAAQIDRMEGQEQRRVRSIRRLFDLDEP